MKESRIYIAVGAIVIVGLSLLSLGVGSLGFLDQDYSRFLQGQGVLGLVIAAVNGAYLWQRSVE